MLPVLSSGGASVSGPPEFTKYIGSALQLLGSHGNPAVLAVLGSWFQASASWRPSKCLCTGSDFLGWLRACVKGWRHCGQLSSRTRPKLSAPDFSKYFSWAYRGHPWFVPPPPRGPLESGPSNGVAKAVTKALSPTCLHPLQRSRFAVHLGLVRPS